MQEASGKKLGFEFPFRPRGCSKKPINDSKFLVIGLITVSGEAKGTGAVLYGPVPLCPPCPPENHAGFPVFGKLSVFR